MGPVGDVDAFAVFGDCGPGQHAHGLGKGEAVLRRQVFRFLELPHRKFHALAVNLHPLAAQQDQRLGPGEQRGGLFFAERFPLQHHLNLEIKKPIESHGGRRARANRRRNLWAHGTIGAPRGGHAYDHAGTFQLGHAGEKSRRLRHLPAQGMEYLTRVDHRLQPATGFGGTLHRHQQRQQLVAVGSAGIFAQRLPERHMLGRGLRR